MFHTDGTTTQERAADGMMALLQMVQRYPWLSAQRKKALYGVLGPLDVVDTIVSLRYDMNATSTSGTSTE
jgi:hypothetical protein